MAYATVSDLEARWRPLTETETTRAGTLLDDAAVRIDVVRPLPEVHTQADLDARKIVSCEMVKRAMMSPTGDGFGVTRTSESVGPFQRSLDFSNPTGDLYLTKADKILLGGGNQRAFTIPMTPEPPVDPLAWLIGE